MPEIGRNDPCPCGSGKKYKKCCLAADDAAAVARARAANEEAAAYAQAEREADALFKALDDLSNRVPGLIKAGKLDEAEAIGHDLLERYPDMPDGLERLAEVHEARGSNKLAADYCRKAAAFQSEGFHADPEERAYLRERADRLDPPEKP